MIQELSVVGENGYDAGSFLNPEENDGRTRIFGILEEAAGTICAWLDAPTGEAQQEFESLVGLTLSDLNVTGVNITWQDENGNILDPDTPLTDGTTYYAISNSTILGGDIVNDVGTTVQDIDGNSYNVIQIGDEYWTQKTTM